MEDIVFIIQNLYSVKEEMRMERVTTKQAAKELKMDVVTLQYLLRQERIPIGYAIKKEGKSRYHYIIYREMLDKFMEGAG